MNLFSEEFIKDTTSVPVRKDIYVYLWKNNKFTEYLAEFRLYDFDIKNMENNKTRNSTTVLIKRVLTEGARTYQSSLTVAAESGTVNCNKIWLPKRDPKKAVELFIKDREHRITDHLDKVKICREEIALLDELELSIN